MTKNISLQTYVPAHIAGWITEAADRFDLSVSIIVRDILAAAFSAQDDANGAPLNTDKLDRQSVFISVALDALLTAHPDKELRDKVFEDYARRIDGLGLAEPSENGGNP